MQPGVVSDDFGAYLRILRRRVRITQRELGLRVGYSEGHVCRLEQNQRVPELSVLAALFVPALGLANDAPAAGRLLDLARRARGHAETGTGDGPRIPAPPAHLVARPAALAGLRDLLDTEPIVVVRGLAGAGKTTLAAEYARSRADRTTVCWITATPGVTTSPEALVRQLARQLAGQGRPGVAALVEPDGRPLPLDRQIDLLVAALARRPTLVCLDNAQTLTGDGVLTTLAHLAALAGSRLLLTSKTSLDLPGEVTYRLDGLDDDQAVDLIGRLDPAMPADLGARLVARTAGNPMLLRLALGQARRPGVPRESVVDSLATNAEIGDYLLRTTLDGLPPPAARLVGLLSVFRHPVDLYDELLAERIQDADGPFDLLDAIGELRHRQLIDEPAAAALHPLVRDHTYARLVGDLARRRRLHRIAATWSEQARDAVLEAAWHFRQAGDDDHAVEVLTDRVRTLAGRGQGLAAADLAGELRDRLRRRPDADAELLWQLHILLGDLLMSTTRWPAAETAYRTALATSGPPALWATAARRLALSLLQRGQHAEALQLCLDAADRLDPRNTLLLAEVTSTQSQARLLLSEFDAALRLGQEAIALAERVTTIAPGPADAVAAIAGGTVGVVLCMHRRFDEAEPQLCAAIDRAERAGLRQIAARARFNLASLYLDQGDLTEPLPLLTTVAAHMAEIGDHYGLARVQHLAAQIAHYRGDRTEADTRYTEACRLKRQVGDAPGLANSELGRASVLRSLGRLDDAIAIHERLSRSTDLDQRARLALLDGYGTTLLAAGRPSDALDQFRAAPDDDVIDLHVALAELAMGSQDKAAELAAHDLPGRDAPLETQLDARLLRAAVALVRRDEDALTAAADELSRWVAATGFALHATTSDELLAAPPMAPVDIPRLLWVRPTDP